MLQRIDHLVLTVRNAETAGDFYCRALGMQEVAADDGRRVLKFGWHTLILQEAGARHDSPTAESPVAGAANLCFVTDLPFGEVMEHLRRCGVRIAQGPAPRDGALGPVLSLFIRDPDGNVVEIASYDLG